MRQLIVRVLITLSLLTVNYLEAHEVLVKVSLSPAGSFEAKSEKVLGQVKKVGVNKYTAEHLWINIIDLKTDNTLRDEHLQKYLNFKKYPKIIMSRIIAIGGKGMGLLSINNEKKPIRFTYKMLNPKKIEATFKIKASEFKLEKVEYLGVGVEDELEIVMIVDIE